MSKNYKVGNLTNDIQIKFEALKLMCVDVFIFDCFKDTIKLFRENTYE